MALQCCARPGQTGATVLPSVCALVSELFAETRRLRSLQQNQPLVHAVFAQAIWVRHRPTGIRCLVPGEASVSRSRGYGIVGSSGARHNLAWESLPWLAPGEGTAAASWRALLSSAFE